MDVLSIKQKITSLAKEHSDIDDSLDGVKYAEIIELEAENLIISYCVERGYQVQGFPIDKMNSGSDEYDEDYFCIERYRMYLDSLALVHKDVADLLWHYSNSFWLNFYENQEAYIADIKHNLNTGALYDIDF